MLYIMTLAEIKSTLGITDTADDTLLTLWAEGLQGRFDDHCRRTLMIGDYTDTFDGGVYWLLLDAYPVVSVSSLTIGGEAVDEDDITVYSARGRIAYGIGIYWPEGPQNIEVIYRGGYVAAEDTPDTGETAMPEALRRAFALQIGFEWRNRAQLGISQVSQGGVSIQQGAQASLALKGMTLLGDVESTLAPYRRMG